MRRLSPGEHNTRWAHLCPMLSSAALRVWGVCPVGPTRGITQGCCLIPFREPEAQALNSQVPALAAGIEKGWEKGSVEVRCP